MIAVNQPIGFEKGIGAAIGNICFTKLNIQNPMHKGLDLNKRR